MLWDFTIPLCYVQPSIRYGILPLWGYCITWYSYFVMWFFIIMWFPTALVSASLHRPKDVKMPRLALFTARGRCWDYPWNWKLRILLVLYEENFMPSLKVSVVDLKVPITDTERDFHWRHRPISYEYPAFLNPWYNIQISHMQRIIEYQHVLSLYSKWKV